MTILSFLAATLVWLGAAAAEGPRGTLVATDMRDNTATVIDVAKREAKRVIPVATFVEGIAITPDGKHVWIGSTVTRHQRFLIPIAKDSLVPTAEVAGSPSPEGVAISPDSRWAFVTLQGRNRVITIDLARGTIAGIAPTGTWSDGVAYSPLEHGR